MRKVVSFFVYSLDGVVDDPQDWVFDRYDDEVTGHLAATIATQDDILLGRGTYEGWLPYWPTASDEPFATFINTTPKHVVSTTLKEVTWSNSTLVSEDAMGHVRRLREQPGGDIGVHGSLGLVRSLLREGLLDEVRLLLMPVVAGKGERLFEGLDEVRRLDLVDVERTATGVVVLTYRMSAPVSS